MVGHRGVADGIPWAGGRGRLREKAGYGLTAGISEGGAVAAQGLGELCGKGILDKCD